MKPAAFLITFCVSGLLMANAQHDAAWKNDLNGLKRNASVPALNALDKQGRTVLGVAVTVGNLKMVRWILENGGDPKLNNGEISPLSQACVDGNFEIAAILLKYGANPNFKTFLNTTPILDAIEIGKNEKLALLLMKCGADLTVRNENGKTLLHLAVANRMDNLVLSLLKKKLNVNSVDDNGQTPLFESTDFKTALLLLENGADPNHLAHDGSTALMWAGRRGSEMIVRLLLKHDADPEIRDQNGARAVDYALKNKKIGIAQLLDPTKAPIHVKELTETQKCEAAKRIGTSTTINYLGLKPDEQIAFAAEKGNLAVLKKFLIDKSRINDVYWNHMTLLQIASYHGQENVVQWLLKKGADPAILIPSEIDVPSLNGMDALSLTFFNQHEDLALLLIKAGAPLNRTYQGGYPLICGFCSQGMEKAVAALIERGADVNQPLPDGTTLLMQAVKGGHLKTVQLLLEKGADPSRRVQSGAMKGKTALDFATELGYGKISDELRSGMK